MPQYYAGITAAENHSLRQGTCYSNVLYELAEHDQFSGGRALVMKLSKSSRGNSTRWQSRPASISRTKG
jgi:hypothetical protein